VSFAPGSLSPGFGSTAGGNYIYIYGNFPYAATGDYVQKGLVAHYDGINNTGKGDKYHSNDATVWNDVTGANPLSLYNAPVGDGGWKSNGFYFNNDTYFNISPVPGTWPVGSAKRTVEITFITPSSGDLTENFDKALFMYGYGAPGQAFGIQYYQTIYFPIEGNQPLYNYSFSKNVLSDLITNSKLNTTTSVYYGAAVKDSKVFINGEKAPISNDLGTGTLNTATNFATIGRYDATRGRYATDFQVLSVRLYSDTLSDIEVQTNSEVDQLRFIAPPTVTIDGVQCKEVVVLSKNFLMCKVPPNNSPGNKNVVISVSGSPDLILNNAYEYVDAGSAFYISSITPIIGKDGDLLTLKGNKLNTISTLEIGGIVCLPESSGNNETTYRIPSGSPGEEVDITVTTSDSKTYRFAKVFEYEK
jgi:hypothetical protein